jgi:O-antigen ligase
MVQIRAVDCAALALLAFEVPSLLSSQDRANSIGAAEVVALSVLVYFALRLLVHAPLRAAWLAALVGLGSAWMAFVGVRQFAAGAEQLTAVGLTDLLAFRSRLLQPIPGWVPGECFTALLLTLPFACAAGVYAWFRPSQVSKARPGAPHVALAVLALLPAVAIAAALLLSLSRAVFWSTILFFAAACGLMAAYRVVTLRTASFLLAGSFGMLLLILACETPLYPDIFRAYAGSHISQARSTEGRIDIWTRSLELTRSHRLWGVGSSNAALFLLSSAGEEETTGFVSRAFSLPIQVLAEKGLIGSAFYSAFLLLVAWEFHRQMRTNMPQAAEGNSVAGGSKRKKAGGNERVRLQAENAHRAMKCCFAAGLIAVLLREVTYSSAEPQHRMRHVRLFQRLHLLCSQLYR